MRLLAIGLALLGPGTWTFESDPPGGPPAGFDLVSTRGVGPGVWKVLQDGENRVLAQLEDSAPAYRYALAVVRDSSYRDLALSVRGRPIAGKRDQSVGLVWRCRDENNYYLARSNVLEQNVRLYRVVNGNRIKFGGREGVPLKTGEWQSLRVEHRGAAIAVFLNGEKLFEAEDRTFSEAGKVGVWIKSDSVTWFDDLAVEELR